MSTVRKIFHAVLVLIGKPPQIPLPPIEPMDICTGTPNNAAAEGGEQAGYEYWSAQSDFADAFDPATGAAW